MDAAGGGGWMVDGDEKVTDSTRIVEVRRGVLDAASVAEASSLAFWFFARVLKGDVDAAVMTHYREEPGRGSVPLASFLPAVDRAGAEAIDAGLRGLLPESIFGVGARVLLDHSRLRYVDPLDEAARAYAPRHRDGQFVPGASVNVVVPLTMFGGPAPGLAIKTSDDPLAIYYPAMEPGDVLLLGSEVEHWRFVHDGMTRPRVNIEYRVAV